MSSSAARKTVGEIRADSAYPLEGFMQAAGLSWAALRAARARGLKTCKVGKRTWVRGSDWIQHLSTCSSSHEVRT